MVATAPPSASGNTPNTVRADVGAARTFRKDRWWFQPLITFSVLVAFIIYSTFRAFQNGDYYVKSSHLISPFYSPCIASDCNRYGAPHVGIFGPWWAISPALIILIVPLGFRMTCYYYRKAYYRSFWLSPPACAVSEPHKAYTGETRFPLIINNIHRYFFIAGLVFNVLLTYDAVIAFSDPKGWGHMGLGTVILIINAVLLWSYSLSCHSCRHIVGGKLRNFSKHPVRYKFWTFVSKLNEKHMQLAWTSLIGVAVTDAYVALVSSGAFHDPRFF